MKSEKVNSDWPLVGNVQVYDFLAKSLVNKKVAGCYIFSGPEGIGKTAAANFFARALVCQPAGKAGQSPAQSAAPCGKCPACLEAAKGTHGDIYLIEKEADKKYISIEQVREFIRSLNLSSFLNSYKIGIIKGAENLSDGAVNALLKTLEEPKPKVVIILTATDFEILPLTIISRSQVLRFRPAASGEIYDELVKNRGASRSQAKNFSRLAAGRPALALKFLEEKEIYENYETQVRTFAVFLNSDLNGRFKAVEDILGDASGQAAAEAALNLISVWRNLARDLILLELNLVELIQHEAFLKDLSELKNKFQLRSLLNMLNQLKRAGDYVRANVNPRLALEDAAVSF